MLPDHLFRAELRLNRKENERTRGLKRLMARFMLRILLEYALPAITCATTLDAYAAKAAQPAPIDACALLTDEDVTASLGRKVHAGERRDSGFVESPVVTKGTYSSTCFWRLGEAPPETDASDSLGGTSYVILNAMQWPAGTDDSRKFLQSFRDAAKEGVIDQTPVALEIGQEALWWGDGVAVRKGRRSFGISVHLIGERAKERGLEEALAKMIVRKL